MILCMLVDAAVLGVVCNVVCNAYAPGSVRANVSGTSDSAPAAIGRASLN